MPDEMTRKKLALEYHQRLNSADIDGICQMFAEDAVFEDPVGLTDHEHPAVGLPAVREHLTRVVNDYKCQNVLGAASASIDAHYLALPLTATIRLPENGGERVVINCVQLFRFGDDDLIKEVKCFWGLTDCTPVTGE